MIRIEDIECEECGSRRLSSSDVNVRLDGSTDVECPDCGTRRLKRFSSSHVDLSRLSGSGDRE